MCSVPSSMAIALALALSVAAAAVSAAPRALLAAPCHYSAGGEYAVLRAAQEFAWDPIAGGRITLKANASACLTALRSVRGSPPSCVAPACALP